MNHIRQADKKDVSRIAEIYIFNNRINFYPIFKNAEYSFGELQVVSYADELLHNDVLNDTYVFDDHNIIKGFVYVKDHEIKKLFVDPFFQNQNIGEKLLEYAMQYNHVSFLWALEKNIRAIQFYQRHGFYITNERKFEEGTEEYLIKLRR